MQITCCGCNQEKVEARLTDGSEIYSHRTDLYELPFWKCDTCGNFVGCHHKTANRTQPLGCIPTKELRTARSAIHKVLDPLWKSGKLKRGEVYKHLSDVLGYRYHTANIRSVEEVDKILSRIQYLSDNYDSIQANKL